MHFRATSQRWWPLILWACTPGPHLSDLHTFEVFAEVGVVLLMFSIGVEFSIPDLMRVKRVALIGAPIGILLVLGVTLGAGRLAGWSTTESLVIGAAASVASTMVLARLLTDARALATTHGRVMIAITLVEDLAVICMTVVIPVLGDSNHGSLLMAAWVLGKALLLLIPLVFLAIKVIPPLLRRVKKTCNSELTLLVGIAICLGTAALAQAAGFSVALGAFLAGVSLSSLPDLHDTHTQMVPLRDAFVALFFVSLGTLIDPRVLFNHLPLLGLMLLLIVIGKFVVWIVVVWLFRYPLRTATAVAAGLTQIVLVLNEVDMGMKRTGYRDVARELAAALHMNYTYGVEFVEVDPIFDLGAEQVHLSDAQQDQRLQQDLQVDPLRYRGLHGTAILSRYPIERARIVRLPVCFDWYATEYKAVSKLEHGKRWSARRLFRERIERELRQGGRMALIADVAVPESSAGEGTIVATHLENKCAPSCRRKQMQALLAEVKAVENPLVLAGDLNTTGRKNTPTSFRDEIMSRVTDYQSGSAKRSPIFIPSGFIGMLSFQSITSTATTIQRHSTCRSSGITANSGFSRQWKNSVSPMALLLIFAANPSARCHKEAARSPTAMSELAKALFRRTRSLATTQD